MISLWVDGCILQVVNPSVLGGRASCNLVVIAVSAGDNFVDGADERNVNRVGILGTVTVLLLNGLARLALVIDSEALLLSHTKDKLLVVELGASEVGLGDDIAFMGLFIGIKGVDLGVIAVLLIAELKPKVLVLQVVVDVDLGLGGTSLVLNSGNGNHFGGVKKCSRIWLRLEIGKSFASLVDAE